MLGPLVLFAAALCLTPGPNIVMVTASAANFGFYRTIPAMIGITCGFGLMIAAAGLGLAGLFQAEPHLHMILKYSGALYLLYLACGIARADGANGNARHGRPIGVIEAAIFTWVNPKGWVTAIGALSAYTSADRNLLLQIMVIVGVLASACLTSVTIWAGFGAAIGRYLRKAYARRIFNVSMAGVLVLSLFPVLR